VVLAANANRALVDWVESGVAGARPTVATLANAMDVGAPSNLERLQHLFAGPVTAIASDSVDDAAIRARIGWASSVWGIDVCPHTACGIEVWARRGSDPEAVIIATAHPAKFEGVVEPLVGHTVDVPPALAAIESRPWQRIVIEPTLDAVVEALA
jgi:threonine synthase